MSDTIERRFGDLTVTIDRLLCVGFGDCIEMAPEKFDLDEDDVVMFRGDDRGGGADDGQAERKRLIEACQACPVDALTVLDSDGNRLAP